VRLTRPFLEETIGDMSFRWLVFGGILLVAPSAASAQDHGVLYHSSGSFYCNTGSVTSCDGDAMCGDGECVGGICLEPDGQVLCYSGDCMESFCPERPGGMRVECVTAGTYALCFYDRLATCVDRGIDYAMCWSREGGTPVSDSSSGDCDMDDVPTAEDHCPCEPKGVAEDPARPGCPREAVVDAGTPADDAGPPPEDAGSGGVDAGGSGGIDAGPNPGDPGATDGMHYHGGAGCASAGAGHGASPWGAALALLLLLSRRRR